MAHYSSLFTLGLLSDRASPPSSPKSNMFYKFRKSSLPTTSISKPSPEYYAASPSDGLPQFTNPFAANSPVSQTSTELRSFLSLDLAADKNLSSGRLLSPLDTANLPLQPLPSSSRSAPHSIIARRPSRDSLRTLPSPRPAPSSALPNVPSQRKDPRAPPPILIPNPSLFPPASSFSRRGSPTSHHPPLSAPPVSFRSSSRTSNHGLPTPSPVSPLSSPSFRRTRQESFMSFSPVGTVTSSRTVRRRNVERSNALACLEGRSRTPGRVPRTVRRRNFMSMSDDDEENRDEDAGVDADVEDDGDAPERPHPTTSMSSFVLSPPPSSPSRSTRERARLPIDEEEDRVLPPPTSNFPTRIQQKRTSSSSSVSKPKSRRGTLESWFPLANFIDLKDDELQGWRGVVEIVNGL